MPNSLSASQSQQLGGLRGLAALMVVASHSSNMGMDLLPGLSLSGIGKHGVFLFFVLSAFLLTLQSLGRVHDGVEWRDHLTSYAVRRFLRIYPLYSLVLLVGLLLAPRGLGVSLEPLAVVSHLALQEGRDIYWSIPVEFKYYLVIPLLAWWLSCTLPRTVRLGAVLLAMAAIYVRFPANEAPLNSTALVFYLPIFLAGSLSAWWWGSSPPSITRESSELRHLGLFADLVLLTMLVLTTPTIARHFDAVVEADFMHRSFLFWAAFWPLMLLALISGKLPTWSYLLRRPLLTACGTWCFSLYLLHMPVLHLVKRLPMPSLAKAWLGLLLAILLASVAYRLVERPAIRFSLRLSGRPS